MTTYYVSTNGNDRTKTGSSDDPFASINKAVQRLKAGDELVVRSGTYKEQVWIGKSGAADKYIVIRAEGTGHDISPRIGSGAELSEFTPVDALLHIGMVNRELIKTSTVPLIDP